MLRGLSSLDLSIKKNWNDWTFALNVNDVLRTNIVEIDDYQQRKLQLHPPESIQKNLYSKPYYNFGNKN
jgi:hypothetical protein